GNLRLHRRSGRPAQTRRQKYSLRQVALDLAPWGRAYPASMERGLFIGELAARSGLSRKALRPYEAQGILAAPPDCFGLSLLLPRRSRAPVLRQSSAPARLDPPGNRARRGNAAGRRHSQCVHVRQVLEQRVADLEGMLGELRHTLRSWQAAG